MALGKCKNCECWDRIDSEKGLCQAHPPNQLTYGSQPARQPETDENLQCNEFIQEN